jgi:hypothetical protein
MNYDEQCANLNLIFNSGPYFGCSNQASFNQGNFCGTLWCSTNINDEGTCNYFSLAGQTETVHDGNVYIYT